MLILRHLSFLFWNPVGSFSDHITLDIDSGHFQEIIR